MAMKEEKPFTVQFLKSLRHFDLRSQLGYVIKYFKAHILLNMRQADFILYVINFTKPLNRKQTVSVKWLPNS